MPTSVSTGEVYPTPSDTRTYSYDEALELSKEYFFGEELPAKVFIDKYALRDGGGNILEPTPDHMHDRLAREFARIDKEKYGLDYKQRFNTYRDAMNRFSRIVPQGSPMSAVGNTYQRMSASNCVVIASPEDSMSGIVNSGLNLAQLMKRRAGVGLDISTLRPDGASVNNAARTTSGAWSFTDFFSYVTRMVGQNNRRGALMVTIDVHHPDVLKFATQKHDLTKVTGANISIRLSNEFLSAVEKDEDYELRWPCEGRPKITKHIRAREVWDTIIDSATKTAEPGLILWDNMVNNLPAHYYDNFKSVSTNPCSEICLSPFDSCRLISINLTGYVRGAFTKDAMFDFSSFKSDILIAMQMADNLVDLELELINRIKEVCEPGPETNLWNKLYKAGEDGRRTGLGTHGLGDTLAQLRLKYDEGEAINMVDKIYSALRDMAYAASVMLAKERGAFPAFDWSKEKHCPFIMDLPESMQKEIEVHGRRNISLLTQAPTGSVSIISKVGKFNRYNVSSGVEPVFRNSYTRRKKINSNEEHARVDFVDVVGDKWQEFTVYHSNVSNFFEVLQDTFGIKLEDTKEVKLPGYFVTSDQIDWEKRVEIQATEQRYIDHSISSCLSEGSHLIHTSSGLRYIEELVSKHDNSGFCKLTEEVNTINHLGKTVSIDEGYNNGEADCYRLEFTGQRDIIGTSNHKLYVLNNKYEYEWKELSKIDIGDYIVCRIGLNCFGDSQRYFSSALGEFKTSVAPNHKPLQIPKRMNKNLARLLGYLVSDGGYVENGIFLSQVKNNVCYDFERIIKEEFGLECHWQLDDRADSELYSIHAHSRVLRDFVKYLGLKSGASNKTVPPVIFKCAGRGQTAEFIKGLTCDGFVSEEKLGLMVTTSYKLGKEIQSLLDQFGIDAGMVKSCEDGAMRVFPNSDKEYKCKESWLVYCAMNEGTKYIDYIGFAEDRKTEELDSKFKRPSRKSTVGEVPDYNLRHDFRKTIMPNITSDTLYQICNSIAGRYRYGMAITRNSLQIMSDLGYAVEPDFLDCTYVFRKVKDVYKVGKKKTYDLHVKDGNSYIVNGVISHNTINLPRGTSPEVVGSLYLEAWKKGLKGVTVYVDGSRDGVLITEDDKKENKKETTEPQVVLRPDLLESETHKMGIDFGDGVKNAYVTVSFFPNTKKPYEIFVNGPTHGLDDKDLQILELTTRNTSMYLRNGLPLTYICEQLDKIGGQYIYSIPTNIAKVLRKYDNNIITGGSFDIVAGGPNEEGAILIPTKTTTPSVEEELSKLSFKKPNGANEHAPLGLVKCPKCRKRSYILGESCGSCTECGHSGCN